MSEVWKDIPGYEGKYQASNLGRVRSVDRRVRVVPRGVEATRPVKGRVLRPAPSKTGHISVVLGRGNTMSVHKCVALAFLGPYPEGHEVLHLDHDPANNRVGNLRYGTRSENLKMDYAAGIRCMKGEQGGNAKLLEADVLAILKDFKPRVVTMKHLATRHGVTVAAISGILYGTNWSHLKCQKK